MRIGLVIADDHPIVLRGLTDLLAVEKDFKILASCSDGEQAINAIRKLKPDILVLDIRMPDKNGLAVLREIKKEKLTTKVVLLTAELTEEELTEAVRLGVRGLVLKELAAKLIVQCIRRVHAGELWLEKQSVSSALENLVHGQAGRMEAAQVLTAKEITVIKHVALGLQNAEVAKQLFISEGTVKTHLHNIYEKLGLNGRVQLTLYAQRTRLV
jgi:DNA-binding NarL/FixJ family response regulator